ncbi:MAG: hypothetical protein PHU74_00235 [Candidatus Pacebacteria bacterium]|nr:hypothetical protein [Candidatus Paceibacterota bacterium]
MNKEKLLILSLSGVLFFAVSFMVYSWSEPTGTMPSGYTEPINTSTNAQKKFGEIAASMFRDAENQNYYIDAGGVKSILAGDLLIDGKIQAGGEILDTDSSSTVVTKGYVDLLLGQTLIEDAPAAKLYFVKDNANYTPKCPVGTIAIARHWLPKTCNGLYGPCCTTYEWAGPDNIPECQAGWNSGGVYIPDPCIADFNDMVICAGPDPADMLFALNHSKTDCTNAGGTVETVEGNVKMCKFPYGKLTGNCRSSWASHPSDECFCPVGWNEYKEWSTTSTSICTWASDVIRYPHEWSNTAREACWDTELPADTPYMLTLVDYKGCY